MFENLEKIEKDGELPMIVQKFEWKGFSVHFRANRDPDDARSSVKVQIEEKKTGDEWTGFLGSLASSGKHDFIFFQHPENGKPVPEGLRKECLKLWERIEKMDAFK